MNPKQHFRDTSQKEPNTFEVTDAMRVLLKINPRSLDDMNMPFRIINHAFGDHELNDALDKSELVSATNSSDIYDLAAKILHMQGPGRLQTLYKMAKNISHIKDSGEALAALHTEQKRVYGNKIRVNAFSGDEMREVFEKLREMDTKVARSTAMIRANNVLDAKTQTP